MPTLPNPIHEDFAQARALGKSLIDAFQIAGGAGQKTSAARLNQRPDVQARIAEIQEDTATKTTYDKISAVRDLVAIIHARASDAGADHPLCEVHMGKNGPYHRFPPKLAALARLIKMMDWNHQTLALAGAEDEASLVDPAVAGNPMMYLRAGLVPPDVREPFYNSPLFRETYAELVRDLLDKDPLTQQSRATIGCRETGFPASDSPHPNHEPSQTPASSSDADNTLTPRQEAFVQARVRGLGVMAAFRAAGYPGSTPNLACRLNRMPKIQARIGEMNLAVSAGTGYRKPDAVHDLVQIIQACPSQAQPDHPLCEMRMSPWGPYHRFPSKLGALTLLIRLLGWRGPIEPAPASTPASDASMLAVTLQPGA